MTVENSTQTREHASVKKATTVVKMAPHPLKGEGHMRPEKIDIGDGLIMRWSTKKDADNVAGLMAEAFRVRPAYSNAPPAESKNIEKKLSNAYPKVVFFPSKITNSGHPWVSRPLKTKNPSPTRWLTTQL